jgi:type IV secretory pathway VirB2 component (pilin)
MAALLVVAVIVIVGVDLLFGALCANDFLVKCLI